MSIEFGSTVKIHPTVVVDYGAKIGDFTSVWHFSHIERTAVIGENCNLGQNVYVGNNAIVGNACRLGNSVSVFSHVELEDFVFCAPFMVFTHVAFPRAAVCRHESFDKTLVRKGATLGANCTVVPGVVVGQGAFVAASATLTASCKDWAMLVGTPARQVGWVSAYGEKIPLPLNGQGSWTCVHTGDVYLLQRGELIRHPGAEDILEYRQGAELVRVRG